MRSGSEKRDFTLPAKTVGIEALISKDLLATFGTRLAEAKM
jgi:hypothetical protein